MKWRRLDPPGEDVCTLRRAARGWILRGQAEFIARQTKHILQYTVHCDRDFRTRRATVTGTIGHRAISRVVLQREGHWFLDGKPLPRVDGCVDIDLAFTPATNLLPIRRLKLKVGQFANVAAAWLPSPRANLRPLDQTYVRTDQSQYEYRSGDFEATLTVDRRGFVEQYGGLWKKR